MAEEQPEWREGRKFTVEQNVFHPATLVCLAAPNKTYVVKSALGYYIEPFSDEAFRINSAGKTALLNSLTWTDARISRPLEMFIKEYPKGKYTRGLVRAELQQIMPAKDTPSTYEGWMEYINNLPEKPPPVKKKSAVEAVIERMAQEAPERRIEVSIEAYERVWLRRSGHRTDRYVGRVPVPVSILRQGEERTLDYIYEHAREHIDAQPDADIEDSEEWEVSDSDGLSIDDHNIEEVMRELERE